MASRTISVSPDLRRKLAERQVNGSGGFQDLMRRLQNTIAGGELQVDEDLQKKIEHYAYDFGSGGWQLLLRELVEEIEQAEDHA